MQIPFVGPTYNGRSNSIDSSRSVNFYVEMDRNNSNPVAMIGTPGTSLWKRVGSEPIRALYKFGDYLYVVSGSSFYRVDSSGNSSLVGSLNTNKGVVRIEDNGIAAKGVGGNQLLVIDTTYGYIYDYVSNTIQVHPSDNFPTPVKTVSYIDGYFIVSSGSMGITTSELYDGTTFNGLAIAAAIATPDGIQSIINIHQQLFIVKEYSTEVWYNTGTATQDGSPFARVSGAVMDYGTSSPYSVARGNNSVFFLATQRLGSGSGAFVGVVELNGYTPQIISPQSITYQISKLNTETAEAYCYSDEGHTFYVLTFPDDNITFCYDTTTKMWHERSTYTKKEHVQFAADGTPTVLSSLPFSKNRHLSSCYVNFAGRHLVGDYRTGNIYEMSSAYYSDNGEPLVSTRTTQILFDKDDKTDIFISKLQVDGEVGVGDQSVYGDISAIGYIADGSLIADGSYYAGAEVLRDSEGSNPEAFLSWSNDSGNTWSNEYAASMGRTGEYETRMLWRRIGLAKNRVFRLRISAPVKKVITSAYVEASR